MNIGSSSEETKNMTKLDYVCDVCGKFIHQRDFNYGATRKTISYELDKNRNVIETICINCNKYHQAAS